MADILISVKNLNKKYKEKVVLDDVSFDVERGSVFALLGENGAGKTTIVRILSTLIQSNGGEATISGYDVAKNPQQIKNLISLTGQYASVDELLTGEENLEMIGRLNHLETRTIKKRMEELLQQFNLTEAAKKSVKSYSGGMRRKLDIAISLMSTPEVIFLDEPTTGLDPRSRKSMWELIQKLADSGVTIFLTTQYLDEADQLADKIAVIDGGKIVEEGTADELKRLIGEEKLELTFSDLQSYLKAEQLLDGEKDDGDCKITIETAGETEHLRIALNILHENDVKPHAVNFRKPTLDDVFMQLTNRR